MTEQQRWAPAAPNGEQRTWNGSLTHPEVLNDTWVTAAEQLAEAAKLGDWAAVLSRLEQGLCDANTWRPGGQSWFTPLHQAAWHGSQRAADAMLERGAWRSQTTSDGRTAADIARGRGHTELAVHLAPPQVQDHVGRDVFDTLDKSLASLITERTASLRSDRLRFPQSRVLTECAPGTQLWFAIPGMYGGFAIELRDYYLFVRSWSRVAGGSGQAHVVTAQNTTLVEHGFV